MRGKLAKKFVIWLIFVSVVLAFVSTGVQLYVEYWRDMKIIENRLEFVKVSYLPSVKKSLWELDEEGLRLHLEGLLNYPEIIRVSVEQRGVSLMSVGQADMGYVERYDYPLSYIVDDKEYKLGSLQVDLSLKLLYERLWGRAFFILGVKLLELSIVAIALFVLFYALVGRFLKVMAEYTGSLDYEKLSNQLKLKRNVPTSVDDEDEIDTMVRAINDMRVNLADSFAQLFKYQEELTTINMQLRKSEQQLLTKNEMLTTSEEQLRESNQQLIEIGEDLVCKQEELEDALKEKIVLLKEVHHRVKNNMQVMASIINLQASRIEDKNLLKIFNDLRSRIHSMATVHEELYRSENFAQIAFPAYVQKLTDYLFKLFAISPGYVNYEVQVEDVSIEIEKAVPCALVINEVISNALKYAFPDKQKGNIFISLCYDEKTKEYILTIKDDGVGIPEDFDIEKSDSLGMTLVSALIKQIGGSLKLSVDNGTCYVISFPR